MHEERPKRAVVYRRVSTDDQVDFGLSLRQQADEGRAEAARLGIPVVSIHADEGVSGGTPLERRTGLLAAIADLAPGDGLVVRDLTRLVRGDPYLVGSIERAVEARRARIWSIAGEGTWSDEPDAVFLRRISYGLGENWKLKVRKNTREALGRKKDAGGRVGQIPYGSRLADDGVSLEPDPRGLEARRVAWRLHAEGRGPRAIAAELTALGFRAHKRRGRVHLRDLELLLQRVGQGWDLGRVRDELAGQVRKTPPKPRPGDGRSWEDYAREVEAAPRRGGDAPTVEELAAALELSRAGLEPRQVLARLERAAAAAPPPLGELFPESTVRHFLAQGAPADVGVEVEKEGVRREAGARPRREGPPGSGVGPRGEPPVPRRRGGRPPLGLDAVSGRGPDPQAADRGQAAQAPRGPRRPPKKIANPGAKGCIPPLTPNGPAV